MSREFSIKQYADDAWAICKAYLDAASAQIAALVTAN